MAQNFRETAHLKTDPKKFEDGWNRIFGKKETEQLEKDLEESKEEKENLNKEDKEQ